ncbi:MAG: hypothetical protein QM762_12690 [Chryseolinea sp.]
MKKVLTTSGGCDCCGDGLGNISGQSGNGSTADIIVRHKLGTKIGNVINEYQENGKKIYELDDLALTGPSVTFANDAPGPYEIGVTVSLVTFNGSIVQGTYPIVSRSITPDPGGLDLNAPFTFQKLNVKRTTPGQAELHTVNAVDDQGQSKSMSASVAFKHSFYQGSSNLALLNQTQIKALANKTLNDSIIQQYGGEKSYVISTNPKYIYWCGPVGTPSVAGAILNGLTLPLVDLSPVDITNTNDGSIITPYWVKRTANLLDPGTYKITVS